MILLYGIHKFGRKITEQKTVYCKTCQEKMMSSKFESFNVLHLFFIPLIPLGKKSVWECTECGIDPDQRTRSSRATKILFLILLIPFMAGVFFGIPETEPASTVWGVRIGMSVVFIFVLLITIYHDPIKEDEGTEQDRPTDE